MKLRDTLNLGRTSFEMRGNLPTKEPRLQKEWLEAKVYEQVQNKNEGKPTFILHDGPPYANGQIHIGHALNKISKDIIVRHKSMTGFRAPYVPGWDTHGLPIESALINEKKINRKDYTLAEFRDMCREYALGQVEGQKEDFMRLGVTGEWDHPYLTLDPEFEAAQLRVFGKMAARGLIYKGLKPIYWSPSSESSLAEAEVEYHDVTSPSIYVAFKVLDGKGVLPEEAEFVIWTTTPWTIPSNMGISVDPQAFYSLVKVDGRQFVVATDLLEAVAKDIGWEDYEVIKEYEGKDFDRLTAKHPFYDRESLLMTGDHVTMDSGTGLVHTAPGHGEEDYLIALEYGVDVISPIDNRGHYTDEAPGFEGMFYKKGDRVVVERLEESGHLLAQSQVEHSYPHDWRTKKPVIYRATPQWFASIDKIRQELLTAVEEDVTWHHPSGLARMYNMVRDRRDWVISRQRVWGVPLPVFYAENGEEIIDQDVINHVADLVEKHGTNIWFEWDSKELLPEGYTHPGSPNGEFTKEKDIMDVWFDSGTSYAGVLMQRDYLNYPADLYLEGSDQYRGWFNSSFTTSIAAFDQSPYKAVLSQGFVMDGKGEKMSKSIGNVILPEDVANELGADIIRLWVSSVDYLYDVRISQEILKQVADSYRRIRNTIRFMLSNIGDFDPAEHRVSYNDLSPADQYMLARLDQYTHDVLTAYEEYHFSTVYTKTINFMTTDLSAFYLDFAKDILYIEAKDDKRRRDMQTVIYEILHRMIRLLSPILIHTMEEAWNVLPGNDKEAFVQLEDMPKVSDIEKANQLVETWELFFHVQHGIYRVLEAAKKFDPPIKKSFEAKVTLYVDEALENSLTQLADNLDQLLIVSQFEMKPIEEAPEEAQRYDDYAVVVTEAEGKVCDRCRAVRPEVGTIEEAPELCERCYDIVKEHFPAYFEQKDEE
ncbi:isoleucine--tRNA ligase [Dolosicoccus paucivorans]|uniref:isoleucine--tRNA ligase n=1 Tax=Dolosicoccus paucivorans TaxID=84521 RepID=UPI00087F7C31|nr:isoleucine--tRNA ligase [Dolosicoccus paucivorans]SDI52098.1 Isoleucyl-tRNA synthetase [Dolosicoccus paucivorans]